MRCARCDRIAVPQVLGRLPDGRLVFGWCAECLAETGCEPIDPASTVPRHRLGRFPALWKGSVLASLGGLGLLATWGVILAYLWGWKLAHPAHPEGVQGIAFGSRTIFSFLGAVMLALLSLIAWTLVLGRGRDRHLLLRSVQVGSMLAGFATLCWGIVRHEPRRDPAIVAIVAASLAISLAVRHLDRRFAGVPNLTTVPRGSLRQQDRTH